MVLTRCANPGPASTPEAIARPSPSPAEQIQVKTIQVNDIHFDKAFYRPGEVVRLVVQLKSEVNGPTRATLVARITHISKLVQSVEQHVTLQNGEQAFEITWVPPTKAPRGYGVDLSLQISQDISLALGSSAFDVLERWTQAPRYGFLTDFAPTRVDIPETMATINRYHLNALQFYDWMYRHEQFLTTQEPYSDPLGRTLSRKTVESLITTAHDYNIAAMPYTAVYAASIDFFNKHPDWAMFGVDRKPLFFGENFLVYMDPRPGSPWTRHLLEQFDQVLQQTEFDGIHLDQYGDPKVGYDQQGNSYKLDNVLAEFINTTHRHVVAYRPDGAVVFNAVTNWPVEAVAPADEDIVYIEVWPPYTWFNELHQLIVQAQELGKGKAVVLAAYISPRLEHNARLIDAIIFASGGGHIELGEGDGMLADAYFPRYEKMPSGLAAVLRRYYDFAVRYEDAIGPSSHDVTRDYAGRIELPGTSTNPSRVMDTVMPIVRESQGYTAISLVNLLGIETAEWNKPIMAAPTPLEDTLLKISGIQQPIEKVWLASPDGDDLALRPLSFSQSAGQVSIQFPGFAYWSMVLIEWQR